jgi:hypothetical protein
MASTSKYQTAGLCKVNKATLTTHRKWRQFILQYSNDKFATVPHLESDTRPELPHMEKNL